MGRLKLNIIEMLMTMTFGLGRRLVTMFGILIGIFALASLVLNFNAQRTLLEATLKQRADELAGLLAEVSSSYLYDFQVADLEIILENILKQPDISELYIVDTEGFMVAEGNPDGTRRFLEKIEDERFEVAATTQEILRERSENALTLTVPVSLAGDPLGLISLTFKLDRYNTNLATVRDLNLTIGSLFLFIGIVMSFVTAKGVTRPLSQLITATERAEKGYLDIELSVRTNDEMQTLARSFTRMLGSLKDSISEVNRLAYEDSLTGLPNRAWFGEYLEETVDAAQRHGVKSAILFLDLDRFKQVNDTLGHDTGDALLRAFSELLRNALNDCNWTNIKAKSSEHRVAPKNDRVAGLARLGGDEFTIVLTGLEDGDAERLALEIITQIERPFNIAGKTIASSTSIGIALLPDHARDPGDIMKKADTAMYQAKRAGRGTYRVFDAADAAGEADRIRTEAELRVALANQEYVLFFQPQFDVQIGALVGAEALVRWQHPQKGFINPSEFLPVAEEAGLMPEIGRNIIEQAIAHAQRWPKMNGNRLRLAMNMSVAEFSHRDNINFLMDTVNASSLHPNQIEVEITEGAAMDDSRIVGEHFRIFKDFGIRLAVDDFGVGYSNLARLKSLDFDTLKIDRTLLAGAGRDLEAERLIETILGLARDLDMHVVAEGIENREQLNFLRKQGCEWAQGYSLARPMEAETFLEFSRNESLEIRSSRREERVA